MFGKGEMRRWATFDEKPPWPGAAVSKIGSGAFFLKDDRECGFDAAAYDIAVWAGLGKGALSRGPPQSRDCVRPA